MKKKLSFGMDLYNTETPQFVKLFYRALLLMTSFWVLTVEPRLHGVSEHLLYEIDSWSVIISGAVYHISQFFGWKDMPQPNTIEQIQHHEEQVLPPVAPASQPDTNQPKQAVPVAVTQTQVPPGQEPAPKQGGEDLQHGDKQPVNVAQEGGTQS